MAKRGRVGRVTLRNFKPWDNYLTAFRKRLGEKGAEDKRARRLLLRKTKKKNKNQNRASWRSENLSLLFLSLPSFTGPPAVFLPFPGQRSHLGLVLNTELGGVFLNFGYTLAIAL